MGSWWTLKEKGEIEALDFDNDVCVILKGRIRYGDCYLPFKALPLEFLRTVLIEDYREVRNDDKELPLEFSRALLKGDYDIPDIVSYFREVQKDDDEPHLCFVETFPRAVQLIPQLCDALRSNYVVVDVSTVSSSTVMKHVFERARAAQAKFRKQQLRFKKIF